MKSQTIAAVLATAIGLPVAVYAFPMCLFGDTYKSDRRVEKNRSAEGPSCPAMPIVKGPVVRDLPLPEKIVARHRERKWRCVRLRADQWEVDVARMPKYEKIRVADPAYAASSCRMAALRN